MPLLDLSRNIIPDALIGGTDYERFTEANAHVCVGNGSGAFNSTHTDLQGASKVRNAVDTGSPSRVDNVLTAVSTFDGDTANFAWEEWGLANGGVGPPAGDLLNRAVQNLGTKASGTTWVFTGTLTFTLPA